MMKKMPKPPIKSGSLTQSRLGFYGKFGSGGNVDISFIQSVMNFDFLNNITLIEDIKGSDKWDVRDLFQRNVDQLRVENDIYPFFKDSETIKFFAPLALVLLPMDKLEINKNLIEINDEDVIEDDTPYIKHSIGDSVDFFECDQAPSFSKVKWNPDKVKLVAVDGQHRISALKMLLDDEKQDPIVQNMNIPILIIGYSKSKNLDENAHVPKLLDVVRQTFVYINNKSQKINESRAILLDNENINSLAVQETIQKAHSNDNNDDDIVSEDSTAIPLVMFDWRGEEVEGKPKSGPASLFSVRDVQAWFTEFLLGDIKNKKSTDKSFRTIIQRLDLESVKVRLTAEDLKGLNHKNSEIAREQVQKILIPSVIYILENLTPYKKYICQIRELQHKTNDVAGRLGPIAYKWICFGKTRLPSSFDENEVNVVWNGMKRDFGLLKSKIPTLLERDIGIRAIWSSYSMLYEHISDAKKETQDWLKFSEWYLKLANKVIDDGWFQGLDQKNSMSKDNRAKLTHIVFNKTGEIVNYKLEASSKGFGAFVMMLILQKNGNQELKDNAWDDLKHGLISTVASGFRKEVKDKMQTEGFGGTKDKIIAEEKRLLGIELDKWEISMRNFFEV